MSGYELCGYDNYAMLQKLTQGQFLRALNAFRKRDLFANVVNDTRVDYLSAALQHPPTETRPSDSEVVAVHRSDERRVDLEKLRHANGLAPQQLEILQRLRSVRWSITSVQYEGLLARVIAHSAITGRWTWLSSHGEQTCIHVAQILTSLAMDD